jgi:hypothetical protein
MSAKPPISKPPRNVITQEAHRREVFWQITMPVGFFGLLVLLGAILIVLQTARGTDPSNWANISLIWLILPMLVILLIILAIVAGLAYAVTWLYIQLPPFAFKTQEFLKLAFIQVKKVCDLIVEPILRLHSFQASNRVLRNKFNNKQRELRRDIQSYMRRR